MWPLWKPAPKISRVHEMIPILHIKEDRETTVTKDGELVRIISLRGQDYTGRDEKLLEAARAQRQSFLEELSSGVSMLIHSARFEIQGELKGDAYESPVVREIAQAWDNTFASSYRTQHYLVIRTARMSLAEKASKRLDKAATKSPEKALNDAIDTTLARLREYQPTVLKGDALVTYWASRVNGRHCFQKDTGGGMLDDLLSDTDLFWPEDKPYQEYLGQTKRFSAWLAIKTYPGTTSGALIDDLFRTRAEFNLFQSVSVLEKDSSEALVQDLQNNVASFIKAGNELMLELNEVRERIAADEIACCRHGWALEVTAPTPGQLEQSVQNITRAVEAHGVRIKRETLNQEPLFWSTWPGLEHHNVRSRVVTTENMSDFATFATIGEGFDSCSWGPMPVTRFRTEAGSEYGFTFHQSPAPQELGHTLVIGGSNAGKTTLMSFLIAMSMKFPGFRGMCLDRLHGMEVMTRMLGGEYTDFSEHSGFNPFQLDDDPENRKFLANVLEMLGQPTDQEERKKIHFAIEQAYRLPKPDRCLDNLINVFGLDEPNTIRARMEEWTTNKPLGGFFSARKDSLSFDKRLVGFDMTLLLNMPRVLGPVANYLFHRLDLVVRKDPGPFVVFVDEVLNYLNEPATAPHVLRSIREIRKQEGVAILAAQEAEAVIEHPMGPDLLKSIATLVLYPAPTAEREHYVKGFGLTDAEFDWIQKPHQRKAMIKRPNTGESAILDVDLKPIGRGLKVFDSSTKAVRKLNDLRRSTPDWREAFLES